MTDREGWIYCIQGESGGPIKIGFAVDVFDRMAALQAASPLKLVLLAGRRAQFWEERRLHQSHGKDRLHGEWFSPSAEVLDLVATMALGEQPTPIEKAKNPPFTEDEYAAEERAALGETFRMILDVLLSSMSRKRAAAVFGVSPRTIDNWRAGECLPACAALIQGGRSNGLVKVWFLGLADAMARSRAENIGLGAAFFAVMEEVRARIAAHAASGSPVPMTYAQSLGFSEAA